MLEVYSTEMRPTVQYSGFSKTVSAKWLQQKRFQQFGKGFPALNAPTLPLLLQCEISAATPGVLTMSNSDRCSTLPESFMSNDMGWPIPPAAPTIATCVFPEEKRHTSPFDYSRRDAIKKFRISYGL